MCRWRVFDCSLELLIRDNNSSISFSSHATLGPRDAHTDQLIVVIHGSAPHYLVDDCQLVVAADTARLELRSPLLVIIADSGSIL